MPCVWHLSGRCLEQLHHEVGRAFELLGHAGVEDLEQARMSWATGDACCLQEPRGERFGLRELGAHELDRELSVGNLVTGDPDGPHAALADLAEEPMLVGDEGAGLHQDWEYVRKPA